MRFVAALLLTAFTFVGFNLSADGSDQINPFTGRITRDRVRMRLHPSLESPIIREMDRDNLVIVTGEVDDFYQVRPPRDIKAFIYRTFVLDGVVEGNRVNVRLDPHLDAPVIAQMNTGDKIDGKISSLNSKWYEIAPPETTTFYIANDYIEKVGDVDYLTKIERRKDEVNRLINSSYLIAQSELQKPFPDIDLDTVFANFNKVINEYTDFPESVKKAKDLLAKVQESYLHQKVAYLESKTNTHSDAWKLRNEKLSEEVKAQQEKLHNLEQQIGHAERVKSANEFYRDWIAEKGPAILNQKMSIWVPAEIALYEEWSEANDNRSINEFYRDQENEAVVLRGVIEPYTRAIRNKPGDFILVNKLNRLPIAYLYSTQMNLQDRVGQEVTIKAVLRPNNHFAYPAYFVMSVE